MAQRNVRGRGAIFPSIKIRSNNLTDAEVWGKKKKAGSTPRFATYLLCHQGCVTGNLSLNFFTYQLRLIPPTSPGCSEHYM